MKYVGLNTEEKRGEEGKGRERREVHPHCEIRCPGDLPNVKSPIVNSPTIVISPSGGFAE